MFKFGFKKGNSFKSMKHLRHGYANPNVLNWHNMIEAFQYHNLYVKWSIEDISFWLIKRWSRVVWAPWMKTLKSKHVTNTRTSHEARNTRKQHLLIIANEDHMCWKKKFTKKFTTSQIQMNHSHTFWLLPLTPIIPLHLLVHYYILCLFAKGQTKNLKGLRSKKNLLNLWCDTHRNLWCTTHRKLIMNL